ncbi:MAG: hypothetical protein R2713_20125 [Ilumatobacteraceae bacterium]|nr:hypothetical protein [Acidimicrobiales bacterium]
MTAVVAIELSGPTTPWSAIGLAVVDGEAWVGGIALRWSPADDTGDTDGTDGTDVTDVTDVTAEGIAVRSWTLAGSPATPDTIDGLATAHVGSIDDLAPVEWAHPLGVTSFDHLVVMTSSIERTCGEIERVTLEPLKRIREAGPVRQGFHRLGGMIVEVVESDRVTAPVASFWGFVWNVPGVDELYDVADRLGPDLLSAPKQAVQPGRFIATFRPAAGLGVPVALMSPHAR